EYFARSQAPANILSVPQHLLVVIDLNGTILYRPSRNNPHRFTARPHALRFLQYCIDTFHVVIWSSARPENVNAIVDAILPPTLKERCVAIWGRDKFHLTPTDYARRVQCYKRLKTVWQDPQVARSHPDFTLGANWDQTNTVLVDDSIEKGQSEPYNLIEIPEYVGNVHESGDILPQVHDYLNQLSLSSNVSAHMRHIPFRAQAAPAGPPGPNGQPVVWGTRV
ncbi:putative FCP1 homology domain-containing protein, partial [Lachnellula suecica]